MPVTNNCIVWNHITCFLRGRATRRRALRGRKYQVSREHWVKWRECPIPTAGVCSPEATPSLARHHVSCIMAKPSLYMYPTRQLTTTEPDPGRICACEPRSFRVRHSRKLSFSPNSVVSYSRCCAPIPPSMNQAAPRSAMAITQTKMKQFLI